MSQIECDDCKQGFELPKLKRKVHRDKVYEFYFLCPHCGKKYISYYTNENIRKNIKRQKKRWSKYRQSKTHENGLMILDEIDNCDEMMKQDMNKLRKAMT